MSNTKTPAGKARPVLSASGSAASASQLAAQSVNGEPHFPHIVIRASAGTGKTFQLSNRFLGLAAAGHPAEHILATTFARKAAGEILDRVLVRLAEAADDPKKLAALQTHLKLPRLDAASCVRLLRELVERLHCLQISTLDSLFIQIAGSFSLELGLPPGWRIAEAIDDKQLRYEAIRQVLRDHPLQDTSQLVRLLGKGDAMRSITEEIADIVAAMYEVYRETVSEPDVWKKLPQHKELDADSLADALAALSLLPPVDGKKLNAARASDFAKATAGDWAAFIEKGLACPLISGSDKYGGQQIPADWAIAYRPLLEHAKAVLVNQLSYQTQGTGRLLAHFNAAYQPLKLARRSLRFDDVTHYLAAALADGRLQDVGYRLDSGVAHLLLDEFQDTSLAQWAVLRPFAKRVTSGQARSLFCVGDVKQAIYGWRGGIADLLTSLGSEISGLVDDALTESHRSSPVIIETVNKVFRDLSSNGALAEYPDAAKCWSEQFSEHTTARIGLAGRCRLLTARSAGANYRSVEQQRATLEDAAALVAEAARENPGRTIGVLVRRNKAVARLIYELREKHKLFASQEGGNPLTDSPAVQLVLSLLTLSDHPGDTVARFHVGHSPLGEALAYADDRDDRRSQQLAADTRARLLDDGYGPTINGWVKMLAPTCGQRDLSRLLQLVEMAYRFDDGKIRRPDEFVALVRQRSVEDPLSAPVRVMTIHQSKGLQFDIVVLPELDERLVGPPPKLVVGRASSTGPIERVCRYAGESVQKLLPPEFQRMFDERTERAVSESLCLLYVAMMRAVYALDMIVAPQHADKSGGWPKTFAGILLSSLGMRDDAPSESAIFDAGDPKWSATEPAAASVSIEADDSPVAVNLESVDVRLRPSPVVRRRGLERRSPSRLEGGTKIDLSQRLRLDTASGMARGTLLHKWLEQIEWLDCNLENAGVPQDTALRELAAPLVDSRVELTSELERFRAVLAKPAVRQALSQASYSDPALGLPKPVLHEIAAGLKSGLVKIELHREWPFAVRLDDAIVSGSIDRLLLFYRGDRVDADSLLAADILDFKTDAIEAGKGVGERAEFYRPQLEAYRRAVAEMLRLQPQRISARMLFVGPGEIFAVANGTENASRDKKVLLTDYAWANLDIERAILAEGGAELVLAERTDEATLAAAAVNADAIMTNWAKVTEPVIAAGRRLRIISRLGIGLDNIDIEAATRRRIVVTNVPDYCVIEVAEHSLALLLALARKIGFYHHETKTGQYRLQAGPPLRRIEGQTLGIIGIGRIGCKLAEKAMPLGLRVLVTSRRRPEALPHGAEFCDLDELLRRSDYVSLHAPLTPETRHLIDAARLARMKPGAYLINTSRGALIDTAAMVAALDSRQLAGAALDVQDPEPPPLDRPPYNDPRVIITPHAAFVSVESLENLRSRTARQVSLYLNGERPENIVNAAVLGESRA